MVFLYCGLLGSWIRYWGRDVSFDIPHSLVRDRRGQCYLYFRFFYLEDWLLRRNSLTGEYWPFAAVFSFFLTTLERESEFRGQCILETSSSYFQM